MQVTPTLKANYPKYLVLIDVQAHKFKGTSETQNCFLLQNLRDF